MLKRIVSVVAMLLIATACEKLGFHLMGTFYACSAACAGWYDPPK